MNDDLINRQAAIDEANAWLLDCFKVQKQNRSCGLIRRLEDLPSAQPSAQPEITNEEIRFSLKQLRVYLIIKIRDGKEGGVPVELLKRVEEIQKYFENVPSAQPTLYGYNIEHLELIARVLQKEDLPPERVVEALTDIGRIVDIVRDELEETLRRAVDQCVTQSIEKKQ